MTHRRRRLVVCTVLAAALGLLPAAAPSQATGVPLVVAPAVPKFGVAPAADSRAMVVGLPLKNGWQIGQVAGRPALQINGAARWQFTTLDTWPGGATRWALARVVVPGGPAPDTSLGFGPGSGVSAGADLAAPLPNGGARIDTGVLQAEVRSGAAFNVLDSVVVDGLQLVKPGTSKGIVAFLPGGIPLHVAPGAKLTIAENGPAFALVKVEGTLADPAGAGVIDFTCRLCFVWGSRDVEVQFTVRNANIQRPKHTSLASLELMVKIAHGGNPVARVALPTGETTQPLGPASTIYAYQAYSSAFTEEVTGGGSNWLPPIPKTGNSTFAQEGYGIVKDGVLIAAGNKDTYPLNEWMDLSGTAGGCTFTIKQMPNFWPAALEAGAAGHVNCGIFTPRNNVGYTWSWRQHESRTAVFSFHKGPPVSPVEVSRRADAPVVGRVPNLLFYELSDGLPYDLVSIPEQNMAYALMGLNHTVDIGNLWFTATRFLPTGATGGENNHDFIERLLASEFLRTGGGGQWMTSMDLALWKSEWQIPRSDNFAHADDPGPINDSVPHTKNVISDDEHRYRGGLVLAYHLSGDERLLDGLKDELEVLPTLDLWAHERSMYQTLVAMVEVADALHAWGTMTPVLRERLEFFCTPVLDIANGVDGFGWDGPPGLGPRGCYVFSEQNKSEKPPGENYITRGFITASMGPRALFRAANFLGPGDPDASLARARLLDLARYSRNELFPWFANPADRHLAYSYGVEQGLVNTWESADFHPILLGMAEAWRQTGDVGFLLKGLEQIQSFASHDNLEWMDKRLESQHFIRAILDAAHLAGIL